MNSGRHIRLLGIATAAWGGFWVLGWPAYFQQYSDAAMVVFSIALLPPIVAIAFATLRRVPTARRLEWATWMAFYFSAPLAVYDWLYCGLYLGHGVRFFTVYWYLTVFYVVPWAVLPPVAAYLNRRRD